MNSGLRRKVLAAGAFVGAYLALISSLEAQSATIYYWVILRPLLAGTNRQSFVIQVDNSTAAAIDAIFAIGGRPGLSGTIAAGTVEYNKDYYTVDHHVWNWHFTAVDEVFDLNTTGFPACECPNQTSDPSDIAANPDEWIRVNGNHYTPEHYEIRSQINPNQRDAMANVSNRGLTGAGEKTLITGLIITGGEPRNVVVRALGPSLSAFGIQQPAGNPRLTLFQGLKAIAGNRDWKSDSRSDELRQRYPSLAPSDDKEAAMLVTLLPGAYTLQAANEDGTEGIVIVEAYDVDGTSPQTAGGSFLH